MNPLFARFLSSICRKEPISGFLLIFGATDALLGGVGGRSNLMLTGVFFVLIGIGLRYLQTQKSRSRGKSQRSRRSMSYYALPPGSSSTARAPLPLLTAKKTPKRSRSN